MGIAVRARQIFGRDRFGLLLVLLISAFLVTGIDDARWMRAVAAGLSVAALLAGFVSAGITTDRARMLGLAAVGVAGTVLVTTMPSTNAGAAVGGLCLALVLGAVLWAVTTRILAHRTVKVSTILGAIAVYFLIGLIFAWTYVVISGVASEPIFQPAEDRVPAYYSFVVLTTLGFGDITPVNEFAQRVSAIEAIVGQVFLATLVARLVSLYGRPERSIDDAP